MEGVVDSLEMLQNNGFKLGMASSSPAIMIDALLQHFDLTKYFNVITSADVVALGKPHPAVFLHCANELNARPNECLVLEDSINGIIAGKAARMKVITIPDKAHRHQPQFTIANAMLHSLKELNVELIAQL
jgi:sugar-phosphatase